MDIRESDVVVVVGGIGGMTRKTISLGILLVLLGSCQFIDRLKSVNKDPALTEIENPVEQRGYKEVTMPMPTAVIATREANSLWRPGSRAFFKDLRASQVGDIVTVTINIQDKADISNRTIQERDSTEQAGVPRFFGQESRIQELGLPEATIPGELLDVQNQRSITGSGSIAREEDIELSIATIVTQVLPNGNFVIVGRQETKVNFEVRELQIAGVIRPQDISPSNTISYEQMAEARLSYGGRGTISDIQQPRYGSEIIDILLPF